MTPDRRGAADGARKEAEVRAAKALERFRRRRKLTQPRAGGAVGLGRASSSSKKNGCCQQQFPQALTEATRAHEEDAHPLARRRTNFGEYAAA
jgi:hypothetical protein